MLKNVVLTTTGVISNIAISAALNQMVNKVNPNLLSITDEPLSKKETVIKYAVMIGTNVAIMVVASSVTHYVTAGVEKVLFSTEEVSA